MPAVIREIHWEWTREAACWSFGVVVTFALFLAIGKFEEKPSGARPEAAFEDLVMVSLPEPPPPPLEVNPVEPQAADLDLGILAAPSDSQVKIAAPPPSLEALFPTPSIAPPASIQIVPPGTKFKPQIESGASFDRIFQTREVDQIPTVLMRISPVIPRDVRNNADSLRVTFFMVVDAEGVPQKLRVVYSSGNPQFDAIVGETLKQWAFSPAVRKGKKVRCLLQQSVTVKWTGGSHFEL